MTAKEIDRILTSIGKELRGPVRREPRKLREHTPNRIKRQEEYIPIARDIVG